MVDNLFECPYCGSFYVCKEDLEKHIEFFGRNKREHLRKWRKMSRELEESLFSAHGSADRQIRVLARIIESLKHG